MKKLFKISLPIILLLFLIVSLVSCSSGTSPNKTSATQTVTTKRGDLRIEVTASGNLALSQTADLAFECGTAAAPSVVDKVLVKEGDAVKEGQLLAELNVSSWEEAKLALERAVLQAEINLKNAKLALEEITNTSATSVYTGASVPPDPLEVEIKKLQVELAKANLESAQKELDKWLATSPQVIAPFDGFVTAVYVEGGDEVKKGTIAVSVADPAKFEAEILVNEMDITSIQVGTTATVQVTALSGLTLPAKVTFISPTATISGGVVNYEVKVEVESTNVMQPSASMPGMPNELSPTQARTEPLEATTPISQLRDGLTITVNILIEEKKDVILVPSRALVRRGRETIVQVLGKDGTVESRIVKAGSSNSLYTEITEGLSEGEQVVLTSSPTRQTTQGGPPPGMFIR